MQMFCESLKIGMLWMCRCGRYEVIDKSAMKRSVDDGRKVKRKRKEKDTERHQRLRRERVQN
jgi:hypothetical protein